MKKRLAYLATTLGVLLLFTLNLLPQPQISAATSNSGCNNGLISNCIGGQAAASQGKSVKQVCPSNTAGYPNSDENSLFFKCQVNWAKNAGKTVPDPNNKAMSFCQQRYAGDYFEDCNKGFQGKSCGNNAVCKKGAEAKQQNAQSTDPNANGDNASDEPPTCESGGFNLSWIMCPIINALAQAIDSTYDDIIKPLLLVNPINITQAGQDETHTFEVWSTFRIYGNVILVIALLVIILSEAIGGGLVDAYTVRKTLPRLLVAAVLINLSIYIVALAVDISNIVGVGIQSLLEEPFRRADAFKQHLGFAASATVAGASGVGLVGVLGAAGTLWAFPTLIPMFIEFFVMFFLLPAFLGIMAVMITILIRTGLIIFLVIISPVAFALYCLPNTEKYFKQWWDLLFRTLLVFPIIAVVFAMGNILGVTINSTVGAWGEEALAQIMGIFAMILPLFLIPFSFRMAGGVMGQISGAVQDRKGRIAAPINKWRGQRASKNLAKAGHTISARATNADRESRRGRFATGLSMAAHAGKIKGSSLTSREAMMDDMRAASRDAEEAHIREQQFKDPAWTTHSGNDTMLEAMQIAHFQGDAAARQHLLDAGVDEAQVGRHMASIRQLQNEYGSANLAGMANAQLPSTGTGYSRGEEDGLITGGGAQAILDSVRSTEDEAAFGSRWAMQSAGFTKSGRVMDAGSFGTAIGIQRRMREMIHNGATDEELAQAVHEGNMALARSAVQTKGMSAVAHSRGQDAQAGVRAVQEEIQLAEQALAATANGGTYQLQVWDEDQGMFVNDPAGPVDRAGAERHYAQVMGQVASLNENIGQFTPENQAIIANGLFNQQVDVTSLPPEMQHALRGPAAVEGPLQPGETRQIEPVAVPHTLTRAELAARLEQSREYGDIVGQVKRTWGANMTPEQRAAAAAAGVDPATFGGGGDTGDGDN